MKKRKIPITNVVVVVVMALAVIAGLFPSFNDHTYTATVTDKERIVKSDDSYYLIFCKNDQDYYEFKNDDNYLRLKFNSSSVYNQIEVGETYKFTVIGFRIGFFSWYENIIKFEKIDWIYTIIIPQSPWLGDYH